MRNRSFRLMNMFDVRRCFSDKEAYSVDMCFLTISIWNQLIRDKRVEDSGPQENNQPYPRECVVVAMQMAEDMIDEVVVPKEFRKKRKKKRK